MKKILAFAGSNSPVSINQTLVETTANLIDFAEVDVISLRSFSVHFYDVEQEKKEGVPEKMIELNSILSQYEGFILATPEHNGIPPAFFLNTLDWLSRVNRNIFNDKPTLLMSTSTGFKGGEGALKILESVIPRFGAKVVKSHAFPSFNHNLKDLEIINPDELIKMKEVLSSFRKELNS